VWVLFGAIVVLGMALDLGVLQRRAHVPSTRESLGWTVLWAGAAAAFGAWIALQRGAQAGVEFATGYLVELALSVDNLFVFVVLFRAFRVPEAYRHRVLVWGVLGAVVMRGIFVAAGTTLLERFEPAMYVFGALLVFSGLRMLRPSPEEETPAPAVLRWFRKHLPAVPDFDGDRFFVRRAGRWLATPLFLVLLSVEFTDVVFAIDSVPAVFSVTRDPMIVYTSNIFAILGLRSLYFLLAGVIDRFWLLKPALALLLLFIGGKMLAAGVVHLPASISLGVIGALIGGGVVLSLILPQPAEKSRG
jgi:tellurite resistance protein TerC